MPLPSNVYRRGAVYWWRRTLRLAKSEAHHKTLGLSLLTRDLRIARGRAAAMTARSETVRMSLYDRIAQGGLSSQEQYRIFMGEMTIYRNALVHEVARWQGDPALRDISDPGRDLQAFETLWRSFAKSGLVEAPSRAYAEQNFVELDEEEQGRLCDLLAATPGFAAAFDAETKAALMRAGVAPTSTNLMLGGKLVMLARMTGAWACRNGLEFTAAPEAGEAPVPGSVEPLPVEASIGAAAVPAADRVPAEWADLTPTQVAERMIAETPRMFEHRQGGKRGSEQTGEQTLRQIRWAARLLELSTPIGQPLWQLSRDDLTRLDRWFDRLPISFGKSPADRDARATLELAEARALARVEEGELTADEIGLMIPTANKHFRKIAQIHAFMRIKVTALADQRISDYVQPDRKDERTARLRYSVSQGRAIFSLPPWTGCAGEHDRLTVGNIVIHDSLFYVLVLVWYTGARREEICKLRIVDVDQIDGIWFLRIETTETGRVKNATSVRCIPLADEVVRLGFIHYVEALRAAGETLVFPDIEPADGTKRKRGDVFYKLWWIYLAPLVPGLVRGQAMHSARHMVSDELKQQAIFLEFRNDLLGHRSAGGEGATRYPSAAALRTVLGIVNRIPNVTEHLPSVSANHIKLLSADQRSRRPARP